MVLNLKQTDFFSNTCTKKSIKYQSTTTSLFFIAVYNQKFTIKYHVRYENLVLRVLLSSVITVEVSSC